MLFNNTYGRHVVDRGVDTILDNLHALLSVPYIGLDLQDRIKFLNPNVFDNIESGIKILNVTRRTDIEWDEELGLVIPDASHEKLDATVVISHKDKHLPLVKRCSVTYRGFYDGPGQDLIAAIGYQIPDELVKNLNANIHAFRSTNTKPKTKIISEYEIGETSSNNGLIL